MIYTLDEPKVHFIDNATIASSAIALKIIANATIFGSVFYKTIHVCFILVSDSNLLTLCLYQGVTESLQKAGVVYKYDLSIPVAELYALVEVMRERLGRGWDKLFSRVFVKVGGIWSQVHHKRIVICDFHF